MPQEYKSTDGQTLQDVCLSIYGTLDNMYKLIIDSDIETIDYLPKTGDIFYYDNGINVGNKRYSTLSNVNLYDF